MILEHLGCNLCGEAAYTERYRKPDNYRWRNQYQFPVVECASCGLVYVNPRPTMDEMDNFYESGYHDDRDSEQHLTRYARQYELVAPHGYRTVLDVGCARGDWLHYLGGRDDQLELHGVDAFSESVNHPEITFHHAQLTDAGLPDDFFDLVTAWAVFEHVHDPRAYFDVVARVLRPEGRFVFLVTNSESLYGRRAYMEDVPRHLYHFNEAVLREYARLVGLRVDNIEFSDALYDGRGTGTFRFGLGELAGYSWEKEYLGRVTKPTRLAMLIGHYLDRLVFHSHWEARRRRSGIVVATMVK